MPRKMPELKKLNVERPYLVELHWMDAMANEAWFTPAEIPEWITNHIGNPINSTGWLLHKDSKCIVLASRRTFYSDGTIHHFGGLHWIPRCWVVKIKRLK